MELTEKELGVVCGGLTAGIYLKEKYGGYAEDMRDLRDKIFQHMFGPDYKNGTYK